MKSLLFLLCGSLLWSVVTLAGEITQQGFAPGEPLAFVAVATDQLQINSMDSRELWNPVYQTKTGLLQPGHSYRIHFTYRILEKNHAEAGLVYLVRPAGVEHGNADLAIAVGDRMEETPVTVEVAIPEQMEHYRFALHTRHGVKAIVENFSISEVLPRFITYAAEKAPRPLSADQVIRATGSANFTVEKPVPAKDAPILYGRDFGFSEKESDNSDAFRRALQACRESGAASLQLDPGTYRFANTEPLLLEGLSDFTLDGNGATLIFSTLVGQVTAPAIRQGGNAHIELKNCRRLWIRRLNIDWDWEQSPLASFVRLTARGTNAREVDIGRNWLEFEFTDTAKFPADRLRIADIEALDENTGSIGRSDRHHSALFQFIENHPEWGNRGKIEWLSPNRVRIYQSRNSGDQNWFFQAAQVGMRYRMRHFAYDTTTLLFHGGNEHITMSEINLYSGPGMGVLLLNDQKYLEFDRFNTTIPPGSRRPISSTSDNFHSSMSQGYLRFINCDFGWGGDDLMNLGDSNGCAAITGPRHLKVSNYQVSYLSPGSTIELRRMNFAPTGLEFTVRSTEEATNTLETVEPLPDSLSREERFILFPRKYDTRNVEIRNCRFHDNRGHGIVAAVRDITIENNEFDHTAFGGIMLSTGYVMNFWGEGLGVANALIRNNRFHLVNPTAADAAEKFAMDIAVFLYAQPGGEETLFPLMNQISIENNVFTDPTGAVLFAQNVNGLLFSGNTIEVNTPRRQEFPHRGAVILEQATNSAVLNNTWRESTLNHPMVMIGTADAAEVTVGGNRVE